MLEIQTQMRTKHLLYISFILIGLFSCNKKDQIEISGNVANGAGRMLYFELFDLKEVKILDSTVLKADGRFHFKTRLPGAPEFYRLRIDNRFIHLAADSSCLIQIQADATNFGIGYQVEGSVVCKRIQSLSDSLGIAVQKVNRLMEQQKNGEVSSQDFKSEILIIFENSRLNAQKIIFENPISPAAYFALFQRIQSYLIFDPYNANDNPYFAAIATAWDAFYPNSLRTQHLKMLALQGMKAIKAEKHASSVKIIEKKEPTIIEIQLRDAFGKMHQLSALKGQVILLNFCLLKAKDSPERNMYLRSLYQEYSKKGFQIYQVCLDNDEHFWKTASVNLPWISVWDPQPENSDYFSSYNLQSLPTSFVIDKEGVIVARDLKDSKLKATIQRLL